MLGRERKYQSRQDSDSPRLTRFPKELPDDSQTPSRSETVRVEAPSPGGEDGLVVVGGDFEAHRLSDQLDSGPEKFRLERGSEGRE